MSTAKSVVIEPVAREYFLSNRYDEDSEHHLTPKNFDFPDLVRTSKMVRGVEVITYEKTNFPKIRAAYSTCVPTWIGGTSMYGKTAANFLQEDLKALKIAEGDSKIRARENWIKVAKKVAPIGKGMNELKQRNVKGAMVDSDYWHEVLTDDHVGPEFGSRLYQKWERNSQSSISFHEWVKDARNCQPIVETFVGRIELASNETYVHPTSKRVLKKVDKSKLCVTYLDTIQRQNYQVNVEDNKLVNANGFPLDTAGYLSMNRRGRAIFVMDPSGQMYAGSHIVNQFHHSSFLSGGAVLGAGEIETNAQGNLTCITNKSGHYKPTVKNMLDVLTVLNEAGIDLTNVEVKILNGNGKASFIYGSAKEFLESGGKGLPSIIERPVEEEEHSFKRELQRFQDMGIDLSQVDVGISNGLGGRQIINALEYLKGNA